MKDNFNNELNVGDEVYFASNRGCGNNYKIAKGRILEFVKDRIKVAPTEGYSYGSYNMKGENVGVKPIFIHPEKVGKINTQYLFSCKNGD